MESNILSHTLSNNSDKKINEGSHRKRKKIINKTNWTLFQYVGSREIKRLSGHLLVRERLFNSFIMKKWDAPCLHGYFFPFSEKSIPAEGPLALSPSNFPMLPFPFFSQTVLGGVGSKGSVATSTWALVRSKDSLHVIIDNFKSVDRVMLPIVWKLILFGNNVWLGSFPDLSVDLFTKGKEV